MFGFSGLNPVSALATYSTGPLGGLATSYFTQTFSSAAQDLLQNLGQQWGLPQSEIEMAQTSFTANAGDYAGTSQNLNETIAARGREIGASPQDVGRAQAEAQEQLNSLLNDIAQSDDVREARAGRRGTSGPGWLRAMAEVLGKKLDELAHEMQDLADKVTKEDPSTSTDFTVVSQQFNMLMNAVSTALKTIGEAMGKQASRQ